MQAAGLGRGGQPRCNAGQLGAATRGARLEAEPMVDYITPVGGGYFFIPPGAGGGSDWVGSGLASA